jgi:zinc metalloprotease ZmpB
MRPILLIIAILLLGPGSRTGALAQTAPTGDTVLAPEARSRLVLFDTTMTSLSVRTDRGRFDAHTGQARALYRLAPLTDRPATAEGAALELVRRERALLGLREPDAELSLADVMLTGVSSHVLFRQVYRGVPVLHRYMRVSLDRAGNPSMVISGIATHVSERSVEIRPQLPAGSALQRARAAVQGPADASQPELFILPSDPPRLVWRVIVWPRGVISELEVLIDADTGRIVQVMEMRTHAHGSHSGHHSVSSSATHFLISGRSGDRPASFGATTVDGSGYVFDPDPLSTAGVGYGGGFADNGDASGPELNAQRRLVPLREITRASDGRYTLTGPHARIVGGAETGYAAYAPPSMAGPDDFRFTRSDLHFEAVNAYYHVDTSQRYVASLDLGRPIQAFPVQVHPRALPGDDSFYLPSRNLLLFGTGGVDDAEDPDVIWHEYGHALLEASAPGLLASTEGRALHEGWADYWAASYSRYLVESGRSARSDWQRLFKWDSGDGSIWAGRVLNRTGRYPDDAPCTISVTCNIYADGVLWATTLMEIYDEVGRGVSDRLNLHSHAYLASPVTMSDAAQALIQADIDLYGGAHLDVLVARLGARGFISTGAYGPVIEHEPIGRMSETGIAVPLTARITGSNEIVAARVVFGFDEEPMFEMDLVAGTGDLFEGVISLPDRPTRVAYYIEARDASGFITRLPADAPGTVFFFRAGVDLSAPSITHQPPTRISPAVWPMPFLIEMDDDADQVLVWMTYRIDGGQVDSLGMSMGESGLFMAAPTGRERFLNASVVEYRIHAARSGAGAPVAMLPSDGWFALPVAVSGTLFSAGFGDRSDASTLSGSWSRGAPTYGLLHALTEGAVLATNPAGRYSETAGISTVELPGLNLSGLEQTYLTFWHWFDTEYASNGAADPAGQETGLFDGGNVKFSTDGGVTWRLLHPEERYNGRLLETYSNPMVGEPAFGGFSYGWRRATVTLPGAADLRLRFDFGTDTGNSQASVSYAGWYIDRIELVTERPEDSEPPVADGLPEPRLIRSAASGPVPISVRVTDDTGVADVLVSYSSSASGTPTLVRLAMRPDDPHIFQGMVGTEGVSPGDKLYYRLIVRDFAGNERVYPDGSDYFTVEYRLLEMDLITHAARSTGGWRISGTGWQVASGASQSRGAIVFDPIDLPANATSLELTMRHLMQLGAGAGGNVKASADGGRTWVVLNPEASYGFVFDEPGHPMHGEPVLSGAMDVTSRFDLSDFRGRQLRLRIDLGLSRPLAGAEHWTIRDVRIHRSTAESGFIVPVKFALHANFPNPFSGASTASYSIADPGPVTLTLYDVLGRRVAVLEDRHFEPGTYITPMDGSRLAPGAYILVLQAGASRQSRTVTVVR